MGVGFSVVVLLDESAEPVQFVSVAVGARLGRHGVVGDLGELRGLLAQGIDVAVGAGDVDAVGAAV